MQRLMEFTDLGLEVEELDGYWAAPGVGPYAVPVERRDTLHDGYEPIRLRRPDDDEDSDPEGA